MANGLTSAIGFFRCVSSSKWVGLAKPHNSSRIGYRSISSTGAALIKGKAVSSLVVGGFAPLATLAQMPSEPGRSPVSIEAREGLHYACWQYACSNIRPRLIKRSMFGLIKCPSPKQPNSGRRSPTTRNSTLGLLPAEGPTKPSKTTPQRAIQVARATGFIDYSTQPLRYSLWIKRFASGTFLTRIFLASHSIFFPERSATRPSSIASVIGPA